MISIETLAQNIDPKRTILLFGSGSSMPSGAPSVSKLISTLEERFNIETGLDLREVSTVAEIKQG